VSKISYSRKQQQIYQNSSPGGTFQYTQTYRYTQPPTNVKRQLSSSTAKSTAGNPPGPGATGLVSVDCPGMRDRLWNQSSITTSTQDKDIWAFAFPVNKKGFFKFLKCI